jgi:hypothetical protein
VTDLKRLPYASLSLDTLVIRSRPLRNAPMKFEKNSPMARTSATQEIGLVKKIDNSPFDMISD